MLLRSLLKAECHQPSKLFNNNENCFDWHERLYVLYKMETWNYFFRFAAEFCFVEFFFPEKLLYKATSEERKRFWRQQCVWVVATKQAFRKGSWKWYVLKYSAFSQYICTGLIHFLCWSDESIPAQDCPKSNASQQLFALKVYSNLELFSVMSGSSSVKLRLSLCGVQVYESHFK